ncbi:HAD-like domain-containing protein [Dactylonectria estremocensis]|uniref:HAD-like domain-containing protein n=1 Tax=Dactylonectria estremocensis TaxID=1079267 RepID=A0A9P9EX07_9HYPO|nr:HAD-like domain-containing protein [Dactylonectria estremocensis]
MSPRDSFPLTKVKALVFDVFGTTVDWRSAVTEELTLRVFRKASSDITTDLKSRLQALTEDDWKKFAQDWRDSYGVFVRGFNPETDAWKTVDQHYHDSLVGLLDSQNLTGLFTPAEIQSLSLVWHRLPPWNDTADGLAKLGETYTTCTLSNGNTALLRDLDDFGSLGFQRFFSAENFRAYKPSPAVYLGATHELGLEPEEVALVAAHLSDLEAAKACGLRTIYVERPGEEEWKKAGEKYWGAKEWVDLWIDEEEDGFVMLAHKLKQAATGESRAVNGAENPN